MKTTILTLLFLTIIRISFCQNPNLIPFVVYKDCLYGLKNYSGKIVWKAELDEVKSLVIKWKGYNEEPEIVLWLAKKYGRYGILDQKGKLVVPFEYKNIRTDRDSMIVASREEKIVDLYDYACVRTNTISGYDDLFGEDQGYRVVKDRKWGFLDTNFQQVLPPEYDAVKIPYMASGNGYSDKNIYSERYLEVKQNDKFGMYDRYTGKMVVQPVYDDLHPQWYVAVCASSTASFLTFKSENSEHGFIDENGDQVLKLHKKSFDIVVTPSDSCGLEALVNLYYRNESGKMIGLNGTTNQRSSEYDELAAFGARSVFKNGKEWGVLDTTMQVVFSSKKYTPLFESLIYYEHPYYFGNVKTYDRRPSFSGLMWSDNVIFISDTTRGLPRKKNDHSCAYPVGMIHYLTGKVIPPKYAKIQAVHCNGNTVFWAFKGTVTCMEMGDHLLGVDIYDDELKLLRSFNKYVDIPNTEVTLNDLFIIHDDEFEKCGAINYRGEEIVPVEYSSYYPIKIPDKNTYNPTRVLYAFYNDRRSGIFRSDGQVLIPFRHGRIESAQGILLAGIGDSSLACYDIDGNMLLDDCDYSIQAAALNEQGTCLVPYEYGESPAKSTYIFRGKEIYRIVNSQLQRVDSTTFQFNTNYLLFAYGHAINRKGELVKFNFRTCYFPRNACSLGFNDESEIVYQEPKQTSSYTPPPTPAKKRDFEWKPVYEKGKVLKGWGVYNSSGILLHNQLFDYPVNVKTPQTALFHTNGKFGVFNESFQIMHEPKYDYIYPYKGYLMYSDSSWRWYSSKTGTFSEAYDVISVYPFGDKQFIFHQGKIGVLNDSLRWVIPLTDSVELVKNANLCKVLDIKEKVGPSISPKTLGLILNGTPEKLYRQRNNALIIQAAYHYSTAVDPMEIDPVDDYYSAKIPDKVSFTLRSGKRLGQRRVHVATSSFLTEEHTFCEYTSNSRWYCAERKLFNYRIVNGAFVLLQFEDVFKTDQASVSKLDELLLETITENQTFGAHCTDIQAHIAELKKNFLMTTYGVEFYKTEGFDLNLVFDYRDIQFLLKEPEKWKNLKAK